MTEAARPKLLKTYFMLMVSDMDRASRFYQRVFALVPKFESSEWTELAAGGAVVALHGGGKPGPVETGLGFEVDDIAAACVLVRETGGSIVSPPKQEEHVDLRRATAADPDGNQFSIVQTG
jgi:predicted enzyme related to lactoylglutathione lyase